MEAESDKPEAERPKKFPLPLIVQRLGIPKRYRHWVKKAERGSYKAALSLKCLECSSWQRVEVALCTVTDCPLWHVRPYGRRRKRKPGEEKS